MKKIHIEFSDERLITPSGLVFVGQILGKSCFVKNQPCSNLKRLSVETDKKWRRAPHLYRHALSGETPV